MTDVLERRALQTGKAFIKQGEDNDRAYVIQDGEVSAFKTHDGKKIEIARFGPNTIIGEVNLMIDEQSTLSYEATKMSTVVTITRQDFQKRLARADKSIATIMEHAVNKIKLYESQEIQKILDNSDIDETALKIVQSLLSGLPLDKKAQYEDAILPHINKLIKNIKEIKEQSKPVEITE